MTSQPAPKQHLVPYDLYVKVWIALLALTVVTVSVSYVNMKHVALLTAALIATAKAALVLLYFMHIRFARPIFIIMILVVIVTYGVLVGLTFVDYSYR